MILTNLAFSINQHLTHLESTLEGRPGLIPAAVWQQSMWPVTLRVYQIPRKQLPSDFCRRSSVCFSHSFKSVHLPISFFDFFSSKEEALSSHTVPEAVYSLALLLPSTEQTLLLQFLLLTMLTPTPVCSAHL